MLDFSLNSLTEEIPIQRLVNLVSLNLSHNRLYGSIPNAFGKLPTTVDVNLSYNELIGPVPTSFPIFVNNLSIQVFQGNPGLCGNVTGLKPCESQNFVKKNSDGFHHRLILAVYDEILKLTNDFDNAYCIGTGGYDSVYKAELQPNNTTIVVKINHSSSSKKVDHTSFLNKLIIQASLMRYEH
ncbi:putative non-specific serine/threonine protein kinase [Helianthus anomalus]